MLPPTAWLSILITLLGVIIFPTGRLDAGTLSEQLISAAELGEIIIVGRGANFIMGLERGIHVRVVAPLDVRVDHMTALLSYSREDARRHIERTDADRRTFIRTHYDAEWGDTSAYHLVVNTGAMSFNAAAGAVRSLVERWPDLQ